MNAGASEAPLFSRKSLFHNALRCSGNGGAAASRESDFRVSLGESSSKPTGRSSLDATLGIGAAQGDVRSLGRKAASWEWGRRRRPPQEVEVEEKHRVRDLTREHAVPV